VIVVPLASVYAVGYIIAVPVFANAMVSHTFKPDGLDHLIFTFAGLLLALFWPVILVAWLLSRLIFTRPEGADHG
jgi:hypothetical protein